MMSPGKVLDRGMLGCGRREGRGGRAEGRGVEGSPGEEGFRGIACPSDAQGFLGAGRVWRGVGGGCSRRSQGLPLTTAHVEVISGS